MCGWEFPVTCVCQWFLESEIEVWHANNFGKYNHINDTSLGQIDKNFNGYLKITTDNSGKYNFS